MFRVLLEDIIILLHNLRVKNWEIHHPLKNTLSPGPLYVRVGRTMDDRSHADSVIRFHAK